MSVLFHNCVCPGKQNIYVVIVPYNLQLAPGRFVTNQVSLKTAKNFIPLLLLFPLLLPLKAFKIISRVNIRKASLGGTQTDQ